MKIKFSWRQIFEILIIFKPTSLGTCQVPHKIWGPISLAVLVFIGYNTNRQAMSFKHVDDQTILELLYLSNLLTGISSYHTTIIRYWYVVLHNNFSNKYLSRCNSDSLDYQCQHMATIRELSMPLPLGAI